MCKAIDFRGKKKILVQEAQHIVGLKRHCHLRVRREKRGMVQHPMAPHRNLCEERPGILEAAELEGACDSGAAILQAELPHTSGVELRESRCNFGAGKSDRWFGHVDWRGRGRRGKEAAKREHTRRNREAALGNWLALFN